MKTSVEALGQVLYNHIWMLTFRTTSQKMTSMTRKEFSVNGYRCLVMEPGQAILQLRIHWLPPQISDGELATALANYGKIEKVSREVWPDPDLGQVQSMVRQVQLQAKRDVTVMDIPHMLTVRGVRVLVQCRGRPPTCLRCKQIGHIRKLCNMPFCTVSNKFGHGKGSCPK